MDSETIRQIQEIVTAAKAPGAVEWINCAAQVGLVGTALAALAYAKKQIDKAAEAHRTAIDAAKKAAEAAETSASVAKGQFLFGLDNLFEGTEISEARIKFKKKVDEVRENVKKSHPEWNETDQHEEFKREFERWLHDTRTTSPDAYHKIMKLPGFYETVGLMAKRGYVDVKEVMNLYGPSIIYVAAATEKHIHKRWDEEPRLKKTYMENFLSLATDTETYLASR